MTTRNDTPQLTAQIPLRLKDEVHKSRREVLLVKISLHNSYAHLLGGVFEC